MPDETPEEPPETRDAAVETSGDPPEGALPPVELRRELPAVAAMAALFLVSVALALVLRPTFAAENYQAFEDPESLVNPLIYLGIVVAFTVVILVIARLGRARVIQGIILGAVLLTLFYVLAPLLDRAIPGGIGFLLSGVASVALTALLYWYPEWYVVDAVGVAVAGGAAAIFGISFGILPSLALLVGFAAYDFIAVYRTKHMLDLADNVLELRLPIMLVVPKTWRYSFLRETRRMRDGDDEDEGGDPQDRDAMFMGLGDIVIPAVLVVSAVHFLPATAGTFLGMTGPLLVGLATLAGTMAGYGVLMYFVMQGKPHAGLPSLNGGAILAFFAALLAVYGSIGPILP